MRLIDLLHRWTGGVVGLLLMLMGLSGALLVNADTLFGPPSPTVERVMPLPDIVAEVTRNPVSKPDYIIFAPVDFPFHRVVYRDGSGRYLDAAGTMVSRWQSQWERPELWLFDFHRYLFMGKQGETIVGIAALLGLGFVVSGTILWWQHRRTFAPRLWPARMTRPAIVRHHRDLGILLVPFLVLSFVTGAAMALKPVGLALVSPWSSAREIAAATAKPVFPAQSLALHPDWKAILAEAKRRFPQAEARLLGFPAKPGDLILVRMRQPGEWLPNGHTQLWFAPADGHLIEARDARALPKGTKILDMAYPLHAAKAGGLLHRLVMTLPGIGLALLGSFSVWAFWFKYRRG